MTKVILVVGKNGLERAHLIHPKGEVEKAIAFYERLVPVLSGIDENVRDGERMGHGNGNKTPHRS